MSWIIYAIVSAFLIAIYNLFLEGAKNMTGNSNIKKHIYLCYILILSGIINSIVILYYRMFHKKDISEFTINKSSLWKIILPSVILSLYMLTNTLALSGGGGISSAIFMLGAAVLTIMGGAYFYKDKINYKIITSFLIAAASVGYSIIESHKIN